MGVYANLRVFSHYSFFESTFSIKKLFEYSKKIGLKSVAICDRMNLFGVVEFMSLAKQYKIHPVLGCLINTYDFGYLPVFVRNSDGYEFLSKILTGAFVRNDKLIYTHELREQKGLICLSGDKGSFTQRENDISKKILELKSIFKDDFYMEVQDNEYKNNVLKFALEYEIPIVCTSPVHFLSSLDVSHYSILQCIENKNKYFPEQDEKNNNFFLKDENFSFDPNLSEGIINSVNIVKKCNFFLESTPPMIPKYSDLDDDEELEKQSKEGLRERLLKTPKEKHNIYFQRLEKELKVLKDKKFSNYFLVTADFVKFAYNNGISVGPGRGSGAGSLVAYSLKITNVDPIFFGLIFERFLNPERNSMPDFDIDFCPTRREEVIEYLRRKYGPSNVVHILTFGTLQPRMVIKDVARTLSVPFIQANAISKLIPQDQVNPVSLAQALNIVPQLRKIKTDKKYTKLIEVALSLEGLIRNSSKHAAGIVISDLPIHTKCPLYRDERGDLVTQLNMNHIEYVGLIKFDFLGLRTLQVLQNTLDLVNKNYNLQLNLDHIPFDDRVAFEKICSTDLEGIFQFEGVGMKSIIRSLQPDCLEDLIAINALYRPGPMKNIPSYIKRKQKKEKVTYLHPKLESILKNTFGIMVYQEQVMDIARICADYTMGEADLLRRAMGKKKHDEMIRQREKFLKGCKQNLIDDKIANIIFDQMSEFSGYGFNKSHSAPYSLIAYLCAYFKGNYPKEFLVSITSLEMSDAVKVLKYIINMRDLKIDILPPCVNYSKKTFNIEGEKIRYGLLAIKGLGNEFADNLEKYQPYDNLQQFLFINKDFLNKKTWEALIFSGAMDCFNISRKVLNTDFKYFLNTSLESINNKQEWDFLEKVKNERKVFGFYFYNPIKKMRSILENIGCLEIKSINYKSVWICGELISIKRKRVKDTSSYAFLELIDETGVTDITVFQNVLEKSNEDLKEGNLLAVYISIDKKKITAMKIMKIEDFIRDFSQKICLQIESKEQLELICNFIEDGNSLLELYINGDFYSTEKKIKDSFELREYFSKNGIMIF